MSEARDAGVIAESRRQADRLARLGWYHSIELPDGSVIEGHQSIEQLRLRLRQFPIPDDLRGKRVLDIGAWDGWFSFEMERRGAEVLALDSAKNTRLLEARALLGSRIEYRIGDICRLTARDLGTFDIVLFLGVLYHLKHPLLALENVCGMCRDMACIESFVTGAGRGALPLMEFYETMELRGQLDNWVGPNAACLMAFARTAGFARVQMESVLGERAHLTGYRAWADDVGQGPAPAILCVENSATRDHVFSTAADDYLTFYFRHESGDLSIGNVFPRVGPYGSRPIHVARLDGGWQATCKVPLGLKPGWHEASLRVDGGRWSAGVRIGIDVTEAERGPYDASVRITRVADGRTFEDNRIRVGDGSSVSVWATGLSGGDVCLRLNGTDLPAIWVAPPDSSAPRQVNALLPVGLSPGAAAIAVVQAGKESQSARVELWQSS